MSNPESVAMARVKAYAAQRRGARNELTDAEHRLYRGVREAVAAGCDYDEVRRAARLTRRKMTQANTEIDGD